MKELLLFQECTVGIIGVVGRGVIRIEADGFHFLPQVTITYYINTGKLNLEVPLLYCFGDGNRQLFSYREKRQYSRETHELSIDYARKEGRNYWDGWEKGYPNRLRYRTILSRKG